jgi:hypothetical protein
MEKKTLKLLLQDLATHASDVAAQIHQPPPSQSITFKIPTGVDRELRNIENKLIDVANAIAGYNSTVG